MDKFMVTEIAYEWKHLYRIDTSNDWTPKIELNTNERTWMRGENVKQSDFRLHGKIESLIIT